MFDADAAKTKSKVQMLKTRKRREPETNFPLWFLARKRERKKSKNWDDSRNKKKLGILRGLEGFRGAQRGAKGRWEGSLRI